MPIDPGDFTKNILLFSRKLRALGLPVTLGRTLGVLEGLNVIRLEEKEEVYVLFSSHFVSRPEEIPVFEKAFEEFWHPFTASRVISSRRDKGPLPGALPLEIAGEGESSDGRLKKDSRIPAYSPWEELKKKDFGQLKGEESPDVQQVILALAQQIGQRMGRRLKPTRKGKRVDFPRTLRRSLRHGGELMILFKKRPRPRKTRFVVLCDVSGSMDSYSRFLLEFMYGFQQKVPRVETFVFSTRLSRITQQLRLRRMAGAYKEISETVEDWSGGTRIGSSILEYNRRYGGKYSGNKTILILLSDGWDQGEIELLDRELKALKRRVQRLMWLNPLLGMPNYQPIDRGMKTALPYADDFLDCHDLEKLEEFGRSLEKVGSA